MPALRSLAQSTDKPISLVVPAPPGGTTDVIARLVGQELGESLGSPVIFENRAGASGLIAGGFVAKSPADGSVLLVTTSGQATTPFLFKSIPYDTLNDFVPVGLLASSSYALVVNPSVPAANYAELVELLKRNPGKYAYASPGSGSLQQLAAEMLSRAAGVKITHIPYKGSSALLPDVAAGRVPLMFENIAVVTPHVKSGLLRALAVTRGKREPSLPHIPTLRECGLNVELAGTFGLCAPKGTPPERIAQLNQAVNRILSKPSIAKRLSDLGAEPMPGPPVQLTAWLKSDQSRFGQLIKDIGIEMQ